MLRERASTVAVALSLALWSGTVAAQAVDDSTRNAARTLAGQGKDALDRGDFERARDLLHRAYTLVPAPTIALYEARALTQLSRLVEAEEAYTRAARTSIDAKSPEPFRAAVRDAEKELDALQPRVPRMLVTLRGPGADDARATVTIDGAELNRALLGVEAPVNPGNHALAVAMPDGRRAQLSFSIAEREMKPLSLELPPRDASTKSATPAPAPSATGGASGAPADPAQRPWQKPLAFGLAGVGIAGLTVGVVTGLMASSRYHQAERECPEHACVDGSSGEDALQSFRSLRTASTIGYVAGGVGLAAGITLYVSAPRSAPHREQALELWVRGPSAGLGATF